MNILKFLVRVLFRPTASTAPTTPLGTNLTPAQPFLLDSSSGKPSGKQVVSKDYFYHATNYENLGGIKKSGMDPSAGGKGGAGTQVDSEEFKKKSGGKVHGTGSSQTAGFYGLLHDEPSLFVKAYGDRLFQGKKVPDDPDSLNRFAVILRFPRKMPGVTWKVDPDDAREAYRTTNAIAPKYIEALTTEGWTPVEKLSELDTALGGG